MVKMCVHRPDLRCYHSGCSSLDGMGNVVVCSLVPNPDGYCLPRKVVVVPVSVFNKHLRRRGGDVFG